MDVRGDWAVVVMISAAIDCGDAQSSNSNGDSETGSGAYGSVGGNWVGGSSSSTSEGGHGAFPPGLEVPVEWICPSATYDEVGREHPIQGVRCDCGCGTYDPDCDYPQVELGNCHEGQTCSETTFTCEGVPVPWVEAGCLDSDYDAGLDNGCQCDCGGVRDPDCDLEGAIESGCDAGDFCVLSLTGSCYTPVPGWTCDPALMANDECECGCGVMDPDCLNSTVDYCWFCGALGSCQKDVCPGSINPTNNAICD